MRRILTIALLVAACGGSEETTKEPVTIALIAPKSGALGFVGDSFERVATTAVNKINAEGGINGRQLVLIVKDDETDAAIAVTRFNEAADEGAVAVIGPATSSAVTDCVMHARDRKVPLISPSSTAPSVATLDDGGFVFRDVPNDNVQGIAVGYYISLPDGLNLQDAHILREDTVYGEGLDTAFRDAFSGTVPTDSITFPQGIYMSAGDVVAKMDEIEALNPLPPVIVLIALEGDAVALMNEWSLRPGLAGIQWFFTDGARSQGFLEGAPDQVLGMKGTAPTYPVTGDAYTELNDAYSAEEWGDVLNDQVYAANVWDGVYLLAAAIAYQDEHFPGQPLGGDNLRDAINTISKGPGQIFHSGQWADMMSAIARGDDVDYDGASGPVDFDDAGEAIGPYEVWTMVEDGAGTRSFEQLEYLDAQDLQAL